MRMEEKDDVRWVTSRDPPPFLGPSLVPIPRGTRFRFSKLESKKVYHIYLQSVKHHFRSFNHVSRYHLILMPSCVAQKSCWELLKVVCPTPRPHLTHSCSLLPALFWVVYSVVCRSSNLSEAEVAANLQRLCDLGYDKPDCLLALRQVHNHFENAVQLLELTQMERERDHALRTGTSNSPPKGLFVTKQQRDFREY
jgi:hypothetical protein